LNEPGFSRTNCSFKPYHQLLEYKNIEVCLLKYLSLENIPSAFQSYHTFLVSYFIQHYEKILEIVKGKENVFVDINVFQDQSCFLNYMTLEQQIVRFYGLLNKN